jgi:hypothetical protein
MFVVHLAQHARQRKKHRYAGKNTATPGWRATTHPLPQGRRPSVHHAPDPASPAAGRSVEVEGDGREEAHHDQRRPPSTSPFAVARRAGFGLQDMEQAEPTPPRWIPACGERLPRCSPLDPLHRIPRRPPARGRETSWT